VNRASLLRLVDTHCHLNLNNFDTDRLQVVERARDTGIIKILIPGIDIESSKSAIRYSQSFPDIYLAVGVHPNSGVTWLKDTVAKLRSMASQAKVVAIGEIGLDYYRDYTPHDTQRKIFLQQLELAAELKLPVIIHNRNATQDIMAILLDWYPGIKKSNSRLKQFPGVMHSFSANLDDAIKLIELNFKIGITGPVTFKNAKELQSIVVNLPLESLILETDSPYLTPQPYRGQRNEPANVRIVAEKIADLKQAPIEVVAQVTTESADQLFDWRVVH
jgi:TatD DNase family protein